MFFETIHTKVIENEDVQFHWTLLSQDIENAEDSIVLLQDIIKLYITVRGFSMVESWNEVYKNKEQTNTQKSTGLRKSLSGTKS